MGLSAVATQERVDQFIEAYISNGGNATAAAITAGYSPGGARTIAARLLKRPTVARRIKRRQNEISRRLKLKADDVMREIARIVYFDPRKLFTPEGRMLEPHEWDDDTAACVQGIEVTETQVGDRNVKKIRLKMASKTQAIETATKILRLQEPTPTNVTINLSDPKDTARRIAFLLARGEASGKVIDQLPQLEQEED